MTPIRVFLADDHPVVLAGVKALVEAEPGMLVVGAAADGDAAVADAGALRPDVAVLDLSMPGLDGAAVVRALRLACPACRSVALTVHDDGGYVRRLLEAGVAGYVLKRSASTELVRAIRVVAAGGVYLDPAVTPQAIGRAVAPGQGVSPAASAGLTPRETEILALTAQGHSNKAIATLLEISVKTVEAHKSRGFDRLGITNRVGLLRFALGQGWLVP